MSSEQDRNLADTLGDVPIFKNLSSVQLSKILGVCTFKSCEPEHRLCVNGLPQDEMYILLSGELAIVTAEGLRAATVSPVASVGEVSLVSGQPRSATVEVISPSNVLILRKVQFEQVMESDVDMVVTVQRNMIDILTQKLVTDNIRKRLYLAEKVRHDDSLKEEREKLEITLDMLTDQGTPRHEAVWQIKDKMDQIPARILIADDDATCRTVVSLALNRFKVSEAVNGKEALEMIEADPPDLVISDIKMPEMDGLTLLMHLRNKHPNLPVLAMSGYVDEEIIDNYPFDGFIQKPAQLDVIRRAVDHALSTRRV